MSTDLSLVTTDEMVDELARRHRAVILAIESELSGDKNGTAFWFRGGGSTCIGMAVRLRCVITREIQSVDAEDDE